MYYRDKIIRILKNYKKDLETFGALKSVEIEKWIEEVKVGKLKNKNLRNFIENQIHYYNPKDRGYTDYLKSLLKVLD